MNMLTRSRGLMLFTLLFFAIACIEGFLYYSAYGDYLLIRILMTLENGIKVFVFSPSITIGNAVSQLHNVHSPFQAFWIYAYAIAVFGGQLCTATVALISIKCFFARNLQILFTPLLCREKLVLFGCNPDSRALIENLFQNPDKKAMVHLFFTEDLSRQDELVLMKRRVVLHHTDIRRAKQVDRRTRRLLSHVKTLILMETSAARNAVLYMVLPHLLSDPAAHLCYFISEADAARNVVEEYFDADHPNPDSNRLPLMFVSPSQLYAQDMFHRNPLWSRENPGDVHLLIAGFGKLGQEILKQAILLGVNSPENSIWIDVVDRHAEHLQDIFMKRFHEKSICRQNDAFCILPHLKSYDPNGSHGELLIRFVAADLTGQRFQSALHTLSAQKPFTYTAVCVEDADNAMACMIALQHFFNQIDRHTPIGVRLQTDSLLVNYLNQNEKEFQDVFPIGEREKALALEFLCAEEYDRAARQYHQLYQAIAGDDSPWESLPYWMQSANRSASLYYGSYPVKLSAKEREELFLFRERFLGRASTPEELDAWLDANQTENPARCRLIELAAQEHRRWSYAMALDGWCNGASRNVRNRIHPCILPWQELVQQERGQDLDKRVIPYDFIPLMIEREVEQ